MKDKWESNCSKCCLCHCFHGIWYPCGRLTRHSQDCLKRPDVPLFSPHLTGEGMQSNIVQPALLWKLLDMLRWLETICEAVGKCLRRSIERSRGTSGNRPIVGTTVDSYIDLGVHSDKTLVWSKNPGSFNVNITILEMFYSTVVFSTVL